MQWRRQVCAPLLASIVASISLVACSGSGTPAPPAEAPKPVEDQASQSGYRPLTFKYDRPVVGAEVQVSLDGLTPGKTVDLMWSTVKGGWVIEDYYYFRGKKYEPLQTRLGQISDRRARPAGGALRDP